jgi:hypothetical protein
MAEIHRVGRNGADVFVVTPHFSSHNSYTDPSHVRHLAARSFQYFTGEDFAGFTGSNVSFSIEKLEVTFGKNSILDGAPLACGMDIPRPGHSLSSENPEVAPLAVNRCRSVSPVH